jgi:hypothetical protein
MVVTVSEIVSLVLAFLGFLGTISMLVMNLRVTGAMAELRASFAGDLAALKVQIAHTRGEFVQDLFSKLREAGFITVRESERMHDENKARLNSIEERLGRMEERLPV